MAATLARHGRGDVGLHLHRFEHQQHIADLQRLADLGRDAAPRCPRPGCGRPLLSFTEPVSAGGGRRRGGTERAGCRGFHCRVRAGGAAGASGSADLDSTS